MFSTSPQSDRFDLNGEMFVNGIGNAECSSRTPLSASEIACVEFLLRAATPGPITARQFYGDHWSRIRGPRKFGHRFRRAVEGHKFRRIRLRGRNSSRSLIYEVLPADNVDPLPHQPGAATDPTLY